MQVKLQGKKSQLEGNFTSFDNRGTSRAILIFFSYYLASLHPPPFRPQQPCTATTTPGPSLAWRQENHSTGPEGRAAVTTWGSSSSSPLSSSLWSLSAWCCSWCMDNQRGLLKRRGSRSVLLTLYNKVFIFFMSKPKHSQNETTTHCITVYLVLKS